MAEEESAQKGPVPGISAQVLPDARPSATEAAPKDPENTAVEPSLVCSFCVNDVCDGYKRNPCEEFEAQSVAVRRWRDLLFLTGKDAPFQVLFLTRCLSRRC